MNRYTIGLAVVTFFTGMASMAAFGDGERHTEVPAAHLPVTTVDPKQQLTSKTEQAIDKQTAHGYTRRSTKQSRCPRLILPD